MKRIIIKSILIVGAILLAIGAILYYKNTVMDPPKQFVFENSHNKALCKEIKLLTSDSLEIQYADVLYMINRDEVEKLVGRDTLDLRIEDALIKYAENGGYPPTQNGDIRSLFWLFSLMALQN